METLANNSIREPRRCWLVIAAVAVAISLAGRRAPADDQAEKPTAVERQYREAEIKVRQAELEQLRARQAAMQKLAEAQMRHNALRERLIEAELGATPADDFDADDLEFTRDYVEPPDRTGAAVAYFEQLVFGSRGTNAVTAHLDRLNALLRTKVGSLHLACGLSHSQTRRLELAGQGDIKRLFDRIDSRKRAYLSMKDEHVDAAMREMLQECMAFQPLLRSPFGDGSLFARTLKHVLSTEQQADYELACEIERLGARMLIRSHGSEEIKTMRMNSATLADYRLAPWKGWGNLRGLSLESTPVVDADLARLKKLTKLELLDLGATRITDDGLVHLQDMHDLKVLDLRRTQVGDAGLAQLSRHTRLKTLHLGCTHVTGAGLVHLRNLTNLESLFIYQTAITDDDLVYLTKLDKLSELGLDGTQITDAGLAHLSHLTNLETLALSSTRLTDAGLVHLENLTKLKTITLFGTQVSETAAAKLKRMLPGLKVIR